MDNLSELDVSPMPGSENLYPNQPDERLPQKHSFTLVVGGRFTGKSSLINSVLRRYLIKKYSMVCIFSPSVLDNTYSYLKKPKYEGKVMFFSKISNDILSELRDLQTERYTEGPTHDMLILIDDFGASQGYKTVLNELATNARHIGISLWISYQYFKNASPTVRSQCTDLLLFKVTQKELGFLLEEGYQGMREADEFLESVKKIINKQFKFAYIRTRDPINPYRVGFTKTFF